MALFGGLDLPDEMRNRLDESIRRVQRWDVDDLLARDVELILDEIVIDFETATIMWDQVTMSEPRPVAGGAVASTLRVPVDGSSRLLTLRSHSGAPAFTTIEGEAQPGEIVFTWTGPPGTPPEAISEWFRQRRERVEQFAPYNNADVPRLNEQMRTAVRAEIEKRRRAELSRLELSASLPFPVTRQPGASQPVPVKRRVVRTSPLPKKAAARFQPEPAMESEAYEQVLTDLAAMATVYERTPLGKMGEEELRNLLLGMLNTNFTGHVSGELFNGAGKTDICVRVEDRNVFIGECKFYKGPASVAKAVDQLLSYVVWRDSKAALLLFVRSGNFTEIVGKAADVIAEHPQCQRRSASRDPSRRTDYVFMRADDHDRAIHLALLPFKLSL